VPAGRADQIIEYVCYCENHKSKVASRPKNCGVRHRLRHSTCLSMCSSVRGPHPEQSESTAASARCYQQDTHSITIHACATDIFLVAP
jgi:hypothetical protein